MQTEGIVVAAQVWFNLASRTVLLRMSASTRQVETSVERVYSQIEGFQINPTCPISGPSYLFGSLYAGLGDKLKILQLQLLEGDSISRDIMTMDRLIAQDAILRTVTLMNKAEDELDAELLQSCYSKNRRVVFDVSGHIKGMPPMEVTPQQLYEETYLALSGFTATHHMWSNPLIGFQDDHDSGLTKAHVCIQVVAYHCIETEGGLQSCTARGSQELTMEFEEGKWVCTRMAIERNVPLDSPELYETAKARADKGIGRKPKQ